MDSVWKGRVKFKLFSHEYSFLLSLPFFLAHTYTHALQKVLIKSTVKRKLNLGVKMFWKCICSLS